MNQIEQNQGKTKYGSSASVYRYAYVQFDGHSLRSTILNFPQSKHQHQISDSTISKSVLEKATIHCGWIALCLPGHTSGARDGVKINRREENMPVYLITNTWRC